MLTTRCPSCHTVFRVRPEQLTRRGGRVRCGKCRTAFSALASLEEIAENDTQVQAPAPEGSATVPMPSSFPETAKPPSTPEISIPARQVDEGSVSLASQPGFSSGLSLQPQTEANPDVTPEPPFVASPVMAGVPIEETPVSHIPDNVPFFVDTPTEPFEEPEPEISEPEIKTERLVSVADDVPTEMYMPDIEQWIKPSSDPQENKHETFVQKSMAPSIETAFSGSSEYFTPPEETALAEPPIECKDNAPSTVETEGNANKDVNGDSFRIDFDFSALEETAETQASVDEWPPLGAVAAALKAEDEATRHTFAPEMFDEAASAGKRRREVAAQGEVYGLEPEFNVAIEFGEAFDKETASKPEGKRLKERSKSRRSKSKTDSKADQSVAKQAESKGETDNPDGANNDLATKLQIQNTIFLHDEVIPAGSRKKHAVQIALWGFGCLLLIAGLLLQLAYIFRTELVRSNPELRPGIEQMCSMLGCKLAYPQEIRFISVVGDLPRLADGAGNLYRMEATLVNTAPFSQQWPSIELTLTDTLQRVVARRVFTPKEWLPTAHVRAEAFQSQDEVVAKIPLQIDQPVDGYNVRVLYP